MHPSRTLTCAMTGLFVGVFLRSFIAVDVWGAIFLVLLATACVAVFLFYNKRESLVTVAIVLVCAGCGIARFDTLARTDAESVVRAGEQISGEAIVVDEPDVREAYTRLVLEPFDTAGRPLYREHILAYAERFPAYRYGDRVRFTGTPTLPEVFASDDTGRTFDYPSYLRKDGIRYQMFRPTVTRIASGQGNPFRAAVLDLKERFSGGLARILPEPESSLAGGLIVGTKQSLGAKLLQEFRAAGVIHLVVLSGYNITIVAEAANRALAFLPAIFSSAIGAIGILLFALMTGAGATVVRASIMALLVIFARRVGRPYAIGRALLLAGSLMILQNPFILVFDPSFQLSFLATFALVYVAPILEPHMTRFPERFGLREIATTTIATQIFVLPFILYTMGDMSIVAVPVNMLILGVVPLTMLLGFVGGLIGMVSTSVGMIVGLPAYALLAYMLGIVDTASRLPLSVVHVPAFPFTVVASIYVVYAYIIYTVHKKRKEKEMIDRSYDRV